MWLVANIFSAIGAGLTAYSTFSKKKENMLTLQALDAGLSVISCCLVGSYSAMTTCAIAAIRNILNAKGKMNGYILGIILISIAVLGLCVNTKGLVGLLPIIASLEYSLVSYKGTTAQSLRYALVINFGLWLAHDICVLLYPAIITDVAIIIVTTINIVRNKPRV